MPSATHRWSSSAVSCRKGSARIVVKLESSNPTGSMKDRVAKAMIERAAGDGRLPPGGTVVEYTGGSTGISLGLICAALGYKAHFVTSDAFSDEKLHTMRAYGAELTIIPSDQRKITEQLIKAMMARAEEISRLPDHWFCNQINNRDGEAGYHSMGEEMWLQSGDVSMRSCRRWAPRIPSTVRACLASSQSARARGGGRAGGVRGARGQASRLAQDRGNRHRVHTLALAARRSE